MSNRIVYGDYTFEDSAIISGSVHIENSMIGETLAADTLTFTVQSEAIGARYLLTNSLQYYLTSDSLKFSVSDGDMAAYTYGDSVMYYHDNTLIGKFYVSNIERVGEYQFTVTAVSAVGLMMSMKHCGGVYFNQLASTLIDSVMSGTGITYTTDSAVGSVRISGWMPIQSRREALQMILFAVGASLVKNANGSLRFTFNQPTEATTISSDRIYLGGSIDKIAHATKVVVTEHLYYALSTTEEVELYYGSLSGNTTVTFDEPYHSYRGDGITVVESYDNYVVISGSGTLYGKPYVHAQTDKAWTDAASSATEKQYSVKDCTLVSALNSANVLERVANYYANVNEVSYGMVVGSEKPADLVAFLNPFHQRQSGYIKSMEMIMSGTLKANAVIDTDWNPKGGGNNFNNYQLFTADGTFTVPSGTTLIRVVMCSGFKGGQGGTHGTAGTAASGQTDCVIQDGSGTRIASAYDSPGTAGVGGVKGSGGTGFYLNQVDLTVTGGSTYAVSIGEGGAGGAAVVNGETQNDGSIGEETTFGSYTSTPFGASVVTTPFINILTGETYGYSGEDGIDGAAGGKGGKTKVIAVDETISAELAENGLATGSWQGGSSGTNEQGFIKSDYWGAGNITLGFGGGGGAAYGSNGGNASTPYIDNRYMTGGHGGNGASAVALVQAALGYCGNGGSGGGGGGGGASRATFKSDGSISHCNGGALGSGSAGQQGSDGLCIVYY